MTLLTAYLRPDPATQATSEPAESRPGWVSQWQFPRPVEGTPPQVQAWAEMVTGLALDPSNLIRRLDDREWLARREQVDSLTRKALP
jgi:hypothetical protein